MIKIRSGFVSLVGRPNVGKSTLLNSLVGYKIAITSNKAQTTRNMIQGIYNDSDSQIVFVDTPGIHKPKHKLGQLLNEEAYYSIEDVDIILFLIDVTMKFGKGDNFVLDKIKEANKPTFLILNKVDKINREELFNLILKYKDLYDFKEIIPISALKDKNTDELIKTLKNYLPDSVKYFPDEDITNTSAEFRVSELIRENVLRLTNEEVPHAVTCIVEEYIEKFDPETYEYPVDGLIFTYNDYQYGKSLGTTGHHPLNMMALKWIDNLYETTIRDIEWNTSRTGLINPVAVFDSVDLDGAETTRATLHNVSYIEGLELGTGDTIQVYRSNMVIPKVHDNLTRSNTFKIPDTCPTCGGEAKIINDNGSKVLKCMNPDCKAKLLSKFVNFVSRDAMNIQGLSEATLKRFIDLGWLKDYVDIYYLAAHKFEMQNLEGFGVRSVSSLLNSIEESRKCKLVNFVTALGIELIGKSIAKDICKFIDKISLSNNENPYNVFIERIKKRKYFGRIDGIGFYTSLSMDGYFKENLEMVEKLAEELEFEMPESKKESAVDLTGMTFVVTGKVNKFANRNAIKDEIESRGGKVAGSVSKNTNYLVNNDVNSTSSKNKKAQQLGIPIIDEDGLIKILNGDMSE